MLWTIFLGSAATNSIMAIYNTYYVKCCIGINFHLNIARGDITFAYTHFQQLASQHYYYNMTHQYQCRYIGQHSPLLCMLMKANAINFKHPVINFHAISYSWKWCCRYSFANNIANQGNVWFNSTSGNCCNYLYWIWQF